MKEKTNFGRFANAVKALFLSLLMGPLLICALTPNLNLSTLFPFFFSFSLAKIFDAETVRGASYTQMLHEIGAYLSKISLFEFLKIGGWCLFFFILLFNFFEWLDRPKGQ